MNILSNSIESIVDEGEIRIKTRYSEEHVDIYFKDSGVGIPEDIQRNIFEPFFTTKDVGKGVGLGLSISYGIIKKHNGEIKVNSKLGEGTEFIITLPVTQIISDEKN